MSWSFQLMNGDLNLAGPGGFATVTGQSKLVQDLKCWFLEPRGTDPIHPDYGSVLDGGINPDGSSPDPFIGGLVDGETLLNIESETRRVLAAYQQQQQQRIVADMATYNGKNTMSQGEILSSIVNVNIQQVSDTVLVQPVLMTADGDYLSFVQPVGA